MLSTPAACPYCSPQISALCPHDADQRGALQPRARSAGRLWGRKCCGTQASRADTTCGRACQALTADSARTQAAAAPAGPGGSPPPGHAANCDKKMRR